MSSVVAMILSAWSRAITTVLIDHDEARCEHGGDSILGLLAILLFCLEQLDLLVEFVNFLKLLLNSLCLSQRSSLLLQDFLLSTSALRSYFHTLWKIKGQYGRIQNDQNGSYLQGTSSAIRLGNKA